MTGVRLIALGVLGVLLSAPVNAAQVLSTTPKLAACLKKAEDLPDMGEADAAHWIKQKGGEEAQFCHAVAQFNRNEFTAAAEEFRALAKSHDGTDPRKAGQLHERAGLAYARADDNKNAEIQFSTALALEPDDPDIWVDRANERAGDEKFWDAISDLNHALSIEPEMVDALRLRGHCWMELGNEKNALSDFNIAEQIEDADKAKKSR